MVATVLGKTTCVFFGGRRPQLGQVLGDGFVRLTLLAEFQDRGIDLRRDGEAVKGADVPGLVEMVRKSEFSHVRDRRTWENFIG